MKPYKITIASALLLPMLCFIMAWKPMASSSSDSDELPEFIMMTIPMMEVSKMHTLEVLDAMPEDQFHFKPTDVNKSFGGQMVHIAYSLHLFTESMLLGNPVQPKEPDASKMTKAEIRQMMSDSYDNAIESLQGITEEKLAEELPRGITRGQGVIFALDHTTNHRAKANLYLRLNGIEPPNYKFL